VGSLRSLAARNAAQPASDRRKPERRRQLFAKFHQADVDFALRRLDCLGVFLPDLLLNERASDELVEARSRVRAPRPPRPGSSTDRRISSSMSLERMA